MQIGIDEVGRGSLAGPLVVGAVSINTPILGLKDSKLLSKLSRQRIAQTIYLKAQAASLGWVWPHEIDELGLTEATTLAITRALDRISDPIDSIIIDGSYNYLPKNKLASTLVKADLLIPSVSAASVIAKVARDNYMVSISHYLPAYHFESHVGYGTKAHLDALLLYGPSVLHRLSFAPLAKSGKEVLNTV